jgi:hypothetical protein
MPTEESTSFEPYTCTVIAFGKHRDETVHATSFEKAAKSMAMLLAKLDFLDGIRPNKTWVLEIVHETSGRRQKFQVQAIVDFAATPW